MNQNKRLFWHGFKAKLIQIVGLMILVFSFYFLFFHWTITLVGIIIGIVIIYKGSSQRFDYQRQSGHIIHGGDW